MGFLDNICYRPWEGSHCRSKLCLVLDESGLSLMQSTILAVARASRAKVRKKYIIGRMVTTRAGLDSRPICNTFVLARLHTLDTLRKSISRNALWTNRPRSDLRFRNRKRFYLRCSNNNKKYVNPPRRLMR
jgi:hypothetical protein